MRPAFSLIFFTTLIGAAQGLVCALALVALFGPGLMAPGFLTAALLVAGALLAAGLAASFLHLGRKTRAWRAVLMWRSSWMAREVIDHRRPEPGREPGAGVGQCAACQ